MAANIGSPDRLSHTLVWDTVNLASRLQELDRELETELIPSRATKAELGNSIPLKGVPTRHVKESSQVAAMYTPDPPSSHACW